MRQFDHIIWDWNGTIVDDTGICLIILNGQLTAHGLPAMSLEEYRSQFCFPVREFYKQIGLATTPEEFETQNLKFLKKYNQLRTSCLLHSGVKEVLEIFVNQGGTHSVLSAYEASFLKEMVQIFNLQNYFTTITGIDTVHASSKIDEGRELIEHLPYKKNRIMMEGDSTHDYEAATAMGIQCFLVARGHQSIEQLSLCQAVVLDSHEELLSFL